jgi:hypothetical protein
MRGAGAPTWRWAAAAAVLALALAAPAGTHAAGDEPSAPVLGAEVPAGSGRTVALPRAKQSPHRLDGRFDDWRGRPSGFGGSSLYSAGELVYQDHLFDAFGADNGQDVQRQSVLDPLAEAVQDTYRIEPALQYVPGEFGVPTPGYDLKTNYGDLELVEHADLSELRADVDRDNLWLLARTTTMTDPAKTALVVLLDTAPGSAERAVPFGAGIRSSRADHALLLSGGRGWHADLTTGTVSELPAGSVASDPAGYGNSLEARVPRALVGSLPGRFGLAAATGTPSASDPARLADTGLGANLANVAFRADEPARNWWDKQQAFSLHSGTIDPFFADVDVAKLTAGRNERYVPGPGYHDRIFASDERISTEKGLEGTLQHYGVYLPTAYEEGAESPAQWWFHFRGGTAHIAAAAVPRIFDDMGEDRDALVVSPRGRGTSTWYVGKGQVDFREVWADVHRTFSVDRRREYISGHSMGGWATYLLTILYPDRFAAGLPASAPVTQGGWTGVDFEGCDDIHQEGDETTPCFTGANGGRPRDQFTRPLLENTRWTPLAIYHGTADELVHTPGVEQQALRLRELGHRYRMYQFPAQEHYGPPIADQWGDGARYEFSFVRPIAPPRLTHIRSMPFERATEEVNSGGVDLDFDFNRSYWMSGLEPLDEESGVARFEGRTLGVPEKPHTALPEAGGPAGPDQAGPYVMTGQTWALPGASPARRNAFEASLAGARAVSLDVEAMRLDPDAAVSGDVSTEAPLRLELTGPWPKRLTVTIDGRPATIERTSRRAVVIAVPAGEHSIELRPR